MDAQSRKWRAYNQRTWRAKSHAVAEAEARKRKFVAWYVGQQEKRKVG
jgi:hypothetical protein